MLLRNIGTNKEDKKDKTTTDAIFVGEKNKDWGPPIKTIIEQAGVELWLTPGWDS